MTLNHPPSHNRPPHRPAPPRDDALNSVLLGDSPSIATLRHTLAKMAQAEAPVLIIGESGTGKELAAQAIHRLSRRADGPFVPINCAALPASLIASELFGHERGAFTGADRSRVGRLQAADGGTVFLDEIGDLPLDMQTHLLRFLQEGTIDRLGGSQSVKVDVRVVAATNVPLRQAVADGRFRQDLFYRLNVLAVEMPALRVRPGDVEWLARHFLTRFAAEQGRVLHGFADDAKAVLANHSWPGNVRELIAAVRRAAVMAEGPWVSAADLGLPVEPQRHSPTTAPAAASLACGRRQVEERLVREALINTGRNVKRAAEVLQVSRVTLYRLLDKYGITREDHPQ